MPLILNMRIEDGSQFRGLTRRWPAIVKATMEATAEHWQKTIFPRHFGPRNRSDYGFEKRNDLYLNVIKKVEGEGEGKFRDEVLKGQSRRWLQTLYQVAGTAKRTTVRATAPTYFTKPFVGSFTDPKTGKQRVITRQPDKPDEVTRFNQADRDALEEFAWKQLKKEIEASLPPPETVEIS